MVCPYGVIKRDYSAGKAASKCDLCEDEDIPVCVKNCPNEALKFIDTAEDKKDIVDKQKQARSVNGSNAGEK